MTDVNMPDLGEEVDEATVSFWLVESGDYVAEGADLVEITTEKATFKIPAPCSGIITEILAVEGEIVPTGYTLARIHEGSGEEA